MRVKLRPLQEISGGYILHQMKLEGGPMRLPSEKATMLHC